MSKITSVEVQKRNPHRFNIFIDGMFAFGADEDLVVNFRLLSGKEINPTDLEKILFEAQVGKLMDRMYNLFSIRARSEKEVRDYFRIKSFKLKVKGNEQISEIVIDSLIGKLKQKGMINDLEFAKSWVQARRKSKQKGKTALKSELFQKGIDRDIIEEVLAESSNENEEVLALQALEKKLKSWSNLDKIHFKKKAYEFLGRRGFGYEIISVVVAKMMEKM